MHCILKQLFNHVGNHVALKYKSNYAKTTFAPCTENSHYVRVLIAHIITPLSKNLVRVAMILEYTRSYTHIRSSARMFYLHAHGRSRKNTPQRRLQQRATRTTAPAWIPVRALPTAPKSLAAVAEKRKYNTTEKKKETLL